MQSKKAAKSMLFSMTKLLRHMRPDIHSHGGSSSFGKISYMHHDQWIADCVAMFKWQQAHIRQDCKLDLDAFALRVGFEADSNARIEAIYANLPKL
jgi:hypothetical protein